MNMKRVLMKQAVKQITVVVYLLTTLAGCATVHPAAPGQGGQAAIEDKSRSRNTLLTIGGILLLAAIIVSEAEDGARDAVRDAGRESTRGMN